MTYINTALIHHLVPFCEGHVGFAEFFRSFENRYKSPFNFDLHGKVFEKIERVNNSKKSNSDYTKMSSRTIRKKPSSSAKQKYLLTY